MTETCSPATIESHTRNARGVQTGYLVYYHAMPTKKLNIHEAQTNLSKHIAGLKPGDRIILCRRNRPVAEILPLVDRPVGLGKGLAEVPESFFDPLPNTILDDFEKASD